MRIVRLLVVLFLLMMTVVSAHAQDDEQTDTHPLLELLARVPLNKDILDSSGAVLHYADISAAEAASIRQIAPANYNDFDALDEVEQAVWFGSISPLNLPFFSELLNSANLMQERSGYDLFQVDRILTAGVESPMTLLQGVFDRDAIANAHSANGYSESELNGVPMWCSPNGCENGDQPDVRNRYMGQFFGAYAGREQTFLIDGDTLISSIDYATLATVSMTINGDEDSVLYLVAYEALAEVITERPGELIQAHFFTPRTIPPAYDLSAYESRDEFDAALEAQANADAVIGVPLQSQWIEDAYTPLPPHGIFVIAHRQEGDEQVTMLAVAYNIPPQSEMALPELEKRIRSFQLESESADGMSLLAASYPDAVVEDGYLYQGNDVYIAAVAVRYPRVEEAIDDPAMDSRSGALYEDWYRAIRSGNFFPLWQFVFPEWMQTEPLESTTP